MIVFSFIIYSERFLLILFIIIKLLLKDIYNYLSEGRQRFVKDFIIFQDETFVTSQNNYININISISEILVIFLSSLESRVANIKIIDRYNSEDFRFYKYKYLYFNLLLYFSIYFHLIKPLIVIYNKNKYIKFII